MNLGFDLDKIFVDYPPFIPGSLIDRLYKKKANGVLQYRIPSKTEQVFRLMTHHPFIRPLIKENIAFIQSLHRNNKYKNFLISSRYGFLKNRTAELMKQLNFHSLFEELHFNYHNEQPHEFKEKVMKELRIDRYVDDDLPLLRYLALKQKEKHFFWFNSKRSGPVTENLFAITKLKDMLTESLQHK